MHKSLDELVNEDTSMKRNRQNNQGQGKQGNGNFQRRNTSKGREGDSGNRRFKDRRDNFEREDD